MNMDRLQGSWKQLRGQFGAWLGNLRGDPRQTNENLNRQRVGRAQWRRGLALEQAARQLDEFLKRHHAR